VNPIQHSGSAKLSLPSEREIIITRDFNAARALVFDAFTRPEHVKRWYGLRSSVLSVCEIDLRVGGAWRYVLRDPDSGAEHAFSGEYQEIVRPERLVCTERYEAVPGSDHLCTVTLTERAGKTTLHNHMQYPSVAQRDGHLQSGMEPGMQQTLDRLDELLQTLARTPL
jgi:uncharacterized protein YndB with AHSA1/START domain